MSLRSGFVRALLVDAVFAAMPVCLALAADGEGAPTAVSEATGGKVAGSADEVKPVGVGQKAPAVAVYDLNGKAVKLAEVYREKPTVLIFYRGGWCPYCNAHLGRLATIEKALINEGYQLIALSPDKPQFAKQLAKDKKYDYTILSDPAAGAARAFGLAFRVDDETLRKYRGYGIDLEERSGRDHHILPVPAAYVIDRTGEIRYAYWNADYKKRIEPDKLLAAAREAKIEESRKRKGGTR